MAEVVGTTASIVGLIGTAITLVQQIKQARARVQGSSKSLDNVSAQLDAIATSLRMVKAEPQIQTVEVEDRIKQIVIVEEELQAFCHRLQTQQARGSVHKYIHALKTGDEDDKELSQILTRLGCARSELHLRISIVNVGLVGNLQDGFQVAWRTLEGTNELLRQGLGVTLVLAERLSGREVKVLDDDTVVLETSDIEALGLGSPAVKTTETSAPDNEPHDNGKEHLRWHNNKTGTKARINVGNMGMDTEIATPMTNVSDSTFQDGFRMMVGNVGKESVSSFNSNFWKD